MKRVPFALADRRDLLTVRVERTNDHLDLGGTAESAKRPERASRMIAGVNAPERDE